jgi:hypothetical protein
MANQKTGIMSWLCVAVPKIGDQAGDEILIQKLRSPTALKQDLISLSCWLKGTFAFTLTASRRNVA